MLTYHQSVVFPSESDLNDNDSECSSGSGKRYRTNLTPKQLHCLVTAYEKNSKPSRDTRRRLSRDLRLDYRVIQVWFQNKRAKCKKPPRFNHQFQQSTMETAGFNHNRFHHGKNKIVYGNTPYIRCNMEINVKIVDNGFLVIFVLIYHFNLLSDLKICRQPAKIFRIF